MLVIRIGGSVVASPFNPKLINAHVDLLLDLKRQGHSVGVVVGGGSLSRDLIGVARAMGLGEVAQDEVAMSVSRLMAQLFVLKLGKHGTSTVPTNIDDAAKLLKRNKIVVMGGLRPGMTTDTVAAMLAERVNADLLVKATDVDGIFTQDPKKYKNAERLMRISFDDLLGFFEKQRHEAGIHQVLDPKAVHILREKKVKTVVVNGFKPENVRLAIKGEEVGTVIA